MAPMTPTTPKQLNMRPDAPPLLPEMEPLPEVLVGCQGGSEN